MGLTLSVGKLAGVTRSDPDFAEIMGQAYGELNAVLAEAGMEPHDEPLDIPDQEFGMPGYGGLHAIRRLAAHYAGHNRLPPSNRDEESSDDPVLNQFMNEHLNSLKRGISRLWPFLKKRPRPKFQHLMLHSDCEGFYLPRDFEDVVFDTARPQRDGIGGMVGSAPRLLSECDELADFLALPKGMDANSDELWRNVENPPKTGAPWQVCGIETFGLAQLTRACELSIACKSALLFG